MTLCWLEVWWSLGGSSNRTRPNMCTMSASKPHLFSEHVGSKLALVIAVLAALHPCTSWRGQLLQLLAISCPHRRTRNNRMSKHWCNQGTIIRIMCVASLASLGLLLALLAFLCIILNQIRSLFSFPYPLPRKKHRWLEETWLPPKKGAFEVVPDLGKLKRHLWKLKDMLLFWHILSHLPPWKVAMLREKPDTIASFKKTIAGQEIVEDHFVDQGETWQMHVGYLYNGALQNVPHVHEVHKIKSHGLELQRRNQNQRSHLARYFKIY